MPWVRYDDEMPNNGKVVMLLTNGMAGAAAIGLHVLANTWARHNGTKGIIAKGVPNVLLGGSHGTKLAKLLEQVGMFDVVEGGWKIHDYEEYADPNDPNPDRSAADRKKELSEKRRAAGSIGGKVKAAKQRSSKATDLLDHLPPENVANGVANVLQSPTPVPVPGPTTTVLGNPSRLPQRLPDDDRIINALWMRAAAHTSRRPDIDDPNAYARKMFNSDLEERAPDCVRYLDTNPDATAEQIAGDVLGLGELDIARARRETQWTG